MPITWKNVSGAGVGQGVGTALTAAGESFKGGLNALQGLVNQGESIAEKNRLAARDTATADAITATQKSASLDDLKGLVEGDLSQASLQEEFGVGVDLAKVMGAQSAKKEKLQGEFTKNLLSANLIGLQDETSDLAGRSRNMAKDMTLKGFSPDQINQAVGSFQQQSSIIDAPSYEQEQSRTKLAGTNAAELQGMTNAMEEFDTELRVGDHGRAHPFMEFKDQGGSSGVGKTLTEVGGNDFLHWTTEQGAGGDDLADKLISFKEDNPNIPYWKIKAAISEGSADTTSNGVFWGGFNVTNMKRALADIDKRSNTWENKENAHRDDMAKKKAAIQARSAKMQEQERLLARTQTLSNRKQFGSR